ncbi:M6 family metalloprotease domain-containing protein [Streptantibioticus parmotrematis]|nr:M6 family metalloprotease domain-containing protein [Streptantibioticus parmotrematis]
MRGGACEGDDACDGDDFGAGDGAFEGGGDDFGGMDGDAFEGPEPYPLRRAAALAVGFLALVAWALAAGPAQAASANGPCALATTGARHSEGLSAWDAAYPRPLGEVNAAMFFLSFPDHTPDVGTGVLAADHFPATTEFFDRASYGRFRLRPRITRRWYRMPRPSTAYGIARAWSPADRTRYIRDALALVGRGDDLRGVPVVYLVADPDAPGVDSDATKVVSFDQPLRAGGTSLKSVVTVFEHHPPDPNVLAHETNHVFDLPDLYRQPPTAPGGGSAGDAAADSWDAQVGDWDLMGSQFGLAPDLFAWHRWKYGWIDRSQVACVDHPGTRTTRTLTPVETAGGTKLVVVRTSATSALAVEARAQRGNDVTACREGVLLYEVRSDVDTGEGPIRVLDGHPRTGACYGASVRPQLADAPLGAGESYAYRFGPSAHETVDVRVDARTAAGDWRVTVVEP